MNTQTSLQVAVVFCAIKNNLTFTRYRQLAEWLGTYNYILPEERFISQATVDCLYSYIRAKPTTAQNKSYDLYAMTNIIYVNLPISYHKELERLLCTKQRLIDS